MRVAIAASGEVDAPVARAVEALRAADVVIAADGGLRHCVAAAVTPDLVVGDLDSASPGDLERVIAAGAEVERHPAEKNETDLELALVAAVDRGAERVVVVGALGGRLDHELANLALLAAPRWHDAAMRIEVQDGPVTLWVVHDALELTLEVGEPVSVLPWTGAASDVTTTGVRWPLTGATLPAGTPRGMSNVVTGDVQSFAVGDGCLLVIHDPREHED